MLPGSRDYQNVAPARATTVVYCAVWTRQRPALYFRCALAVPILRRPTASAVGDVLNNLAALRRVGCLTLRVSVGRTAMAYVRLMLEGRLIVVTCRLRTSPMSICISARNCR